MENKKHQALKYLKIPDWCCILKLIQRLHSWRLRGCGAECKANHIKQLINWWCDAEGGATWIITVKLLTLVLLNSTWTIIPRSFASKLIPAQSETLTKSPPLPYWQSTFICTRALWQRDKACLHCNDGSQRRSEWDETSQVRCRVRFPWQWSLWSLEASDKSVRLFRPLNIFSMYIYKKPVSHSEGGGGGDPQQYWDIYSCICV